jgi:predicted metal-dependent hydrolase
MRSIGARSSPEERLRFNADLLSESAEVRKQVIVHELLHLKVPNHGKVLRALLRAYVGGQDTGIESSTLASRAGRPGNTAP